MADERAWSRGFLEQARADLDAAKSLQGRAPSVVAMLLQMAFEKLGKAALLRNRSLTVERAQATHRSASVLVSILRRRRGLGEDLGFRHAADWRQALDFVVSLEAAHPQLAGDQPHLEYPWEAPPGAVCWPEEHLVVARRLVDSGERLGPKVLRLAVALSARFDELFA